MATYDLNSEWRVPLYGLPKKVVAVIETVAESRQAPIDYVVAPALAVLSVAIGSGVKVVSDFTNHLNLFVGVVGESSSNKSTPTRDLLAPLVEIDRQLYAWYVQEKQKHEMFEAVEAKGKRGKAVQKPTTPPVKQIIISDATVEARLDALRHNPHGILWYRDELKAVFDDFGRYGKSGEASDLLTTFDCGDIKSNRKGDGMTMAESPYLSMLGTIQPSALKATFRKNSFEDGMVPRFLWYEPMTTRRRDYRNSKEPDPELLEWWKSYVMTIYAKRLSADVCLEPGVREILDDFRNSTGNDRVGYDATVWGKLLKYVYKLAGIAAVTNAIANETDGQPLCVSADHMRWAIDMCHYLHRTHMSVERHCLGYKRDEPTRGDLVALVARNWENVPKQLTVALLLKQYPNAIQAEIAKGLGLTEAAISMYKKEYCDKLN